MKNTPEQQAQNKLKHLKEAIALMDELDGRLTWAADFCEHNSISTILNRVAAVVMDAQSELEDMETELEERIQEASNKKKEAEKEVQQEFEQRLVEVLA